MRDLVQIVGVLCSACSERSGIAESNRPVVHDVDLPPLRGNVLVLTVCKGCGALWDVFAKTWRPAR